MSGSGMSPKPQEPTFKSRADILRALADGRTIAVDNENDTPFLIRLDSERGLLVREAGAFAAGIGFSLSRALHRYRIHVEINPHPVGSYLWARLEHQRGKTVGRAGLLRTITPEMAWGSLTFTHDEIIATDWAPR